MHDTREAIYTMQRARILYRITPGAYLPAYRLQCLRFLVQVIVFHDRNHGENSPQHDNTNEVQDILEEILGIVVNPQRSYAEAIGYLEFVHSLAVRQGCSNRLTDVITEVSRSFQSNCQIRHLLGVWHLREGHEKGLHDLRESCKLTIDSTEGLRNLHYIWYLGSTFVDRKQYCNAWSLLTDLRTDEIFGDFSLRVLYADVCVHLGKFTAAGKILNTRPTPVSSGSAAIALEFTRCRKELCNRIRIPQWKERLILNLIEASRVDSARCHVLMDYIVQHNLHEAILDGAGSTPLLLFSKWGLVGSVQELLNYGVDIDHFDIVNNHACTFLTR